MTGRRPASGARVACAVRLQRRRGSTPAGSGGPGEATAAAARCVLARGPRARPTRGSSRCSASVDQRGWLAQRRCEGGCPRALRCCQHVATVMMAFPALRGALEVVATVEPAAAKWLRAEEIQRMGRLNNSALEERVKSLYVEAQVWRDLAQSNEAAANALRDELQQVLNAQQANSQAPLALAPAAPTTTSRAAAGRTTSPPEPEQQARGSTGRRPGHRRCPRMGGRARCAVCGEGAAKVLHCCCCRCRAGVPPPVRVRGKGVGARAFFR
ncbi:probable BOI-related E3 ubiquitin-protein ligase 2 [Miscanthus floridulus]|uniref:probable BOI-related E3 ubiquitin-protein ligase 2 n=1 Tax=Miscanthus floridulus TaxID=154761 RepID=UPI00345A8508